MKYKIGEFCRLLGISPDTLRYYEKRGLLCMPKDPENGYRSFSGLDAPDVWNLFMLRSLDMGLHDIGVLRKRGSFDAQIKYLNRREASLAEEIERLVNKRERIREISDLYNLIHSVGQVHLEEEMPAHYALYVLGDGCRQSEQALAEIPAWVKCLPFTYIAVELTFESLTGGGEKLSVRLGLGILSKNMGKAGLTPGAESVYTPKNARVCIAVRSSDVFGLTKETLKPLYAYLSEHNLQITGVATGRVIYSCCKAKHPEYILALNVPVK